MFAHDSALEGGGFEPSVPLHGELRRRPCGTVGCEGWGRRSGRRGSARFLLLGEPFHGTDRPYGFGRLRFVPLLELLRTLAHVLVVALTWERLFAPVQELGGRIGLVVMPAVWEDRQLGEVFGEPRRGLGNVD